MDNQANLYTQTLPPDQVRANAVASLQSGKDFILITVENKSGKLEINAETNLTTADARALLTFAARTSRHVRPDMNN